MNKKIFNKRWISYVFCMAIVIMFSACAKSDQYSDPEVVAREFWTAIQNRDIKKASDNVYPPARQQLVRMIDKDFQSGRVPYLPDQLEFEVSIKGDRAVAKILKSDGVGCDLIKAEGRWWVQ